MDHKEPDIKVDLLFNKKALLEAKDEVLGFIRTADDDIIEFDEVISDLRKRKIHYEKLIEQGKFDKTAMENSLTDMDIEIRKYRDKIDKLGERKIHFKNIINVLDNKLVKADKFHGNNI